MARKDSVPDSNKNSCDCTTGCFAQLDALNTASQAVLTAQAVLDQAVGQLNQAKTTALPVIRMDTKNLEATAGFTEGDAKTLGVYATPEIFDPNTYQPVLEATARHNYVELMAKKLGVDSLNLYWRPAGTANWLLLSAKRTRFPFHDDTPAPTGETMQAREYMAMGVIADEEIGNPSNIASAVFQA